MLRAYCGTAYESPLTASRTWPFGAKNHRERIKSDYRERRMAVLSDEWDKLS